ncbi:MAG: hypothetical protein ACPGRZ_11655 [Alphaproteobacteria bacterium]
MEWKDVTPAEAEENKYYGLGGWLLFFYVLAVLGFLASFGSLLSLEALKQAFGDKYMIIAGLGIVQGLLYLPFLILAPQKNPLMPKAAISALWLSVAVTAIAGMFVNPSQMMVQLIVSVVLVALFSWYLRKSRRVNVTYLHRVPVEEGISSETPSD